MATAVEKEPATGTCGWPTFEEMQDTLRAARGAMTTARHAAEDLTAETVSTIRRHPLRSVAAAAMTGAVVGSFVAFGAAWFMRPRRRRFPW